MKAIDGASSGNGTVGADAGASAAGGAVGSRVRGGGAMSHTGYQPDRWKTRNHYILWFHDSTFECIAESFTVEHHGCSMPELLALACRRLV